MADLAEYDVALAVYTDAVFTSIDDDYYAAETIVVFSADLRNRFSSLTLVGRQSTPGAQTHSAKYMLRSDIDVVGLPSYSNLKEPLGVAKAAGASVRRFWKVLDHVDAVWLHGPHPLAILFSLVAIVRRRHLVLGVRQNLPAHQRARHPGCHAIYGAAVTLEALWRIIAWRRPTVAVGPDLAQKYRHARPVVDAVISLTTESEIVSQDEADSRDYSGILHLLWVGRLDPEKNPMLTVEVLQILDDLDVAWDLTVCGDGSLREDLEAAIEAAGFGDRVTFAGFVPLAELHPMYFRANVLMHISWTEGVPQVFFEAFAAGLPVAGTNVGGIADAVGDSAVLVPAGDARAMAQAIVKISNEPELRRRLIERGLALSHLHTAENQRGKIAALFQPS